MRLLVVPIYQSQWAYHCSTTIRPTGRLASWVAYATRKWEALAEAKTRTWRRRLYATGTGLMDKIDYHEWFLKSVPSRGDAGDLQKMTVHYPPLLDGTQVQAQLVQMVKERKPYHRRYLTLSCLWLPLSLSFGLVPLIPNIPLFYNLFRVYSHYKAHQGAEHLDWLLANGQIELDAALPALASRADIFQATALTPLPEAVLHDIAHELAWSGVATDLLRAHSQVVSQLTDTNRPASPDHSSSPAADGRPHSQSSADDRSKDFKDKKQD
ncbi:hypothetical protein H4R34_000319 [Dimargaris verticillata]|uniref:Mitochondrial K+-H+ exchange-related-domain-containing protein n=1 Tax=Dimargaris verticillata TaxID=2761393 RepID=A0A9W8EFH8_9FUNG|nr:hypothetical protein H4R34_000319 [Dimargaris verticillata]